MGRNWAGLGAACAAIAAVPPAFAEGLADQVERLEIEAGEAEWEAQSVYARAHQGEPSAQTLDIQFEYGLSDRLSLGFEIEGEREGGEAMQAEAIGLQAKFIAIDPARAGFGIGAQLTLGRDLDAHASAAELRLLGEARFGAVAIAADLQIEGSDAEDAETEAAYALRAETRRGWGVIGLEAGGELGAASSIGLRDTARHWLGPVVAIDPIGPVALEFSVFAPLTDETPDAQARIAIAMAL